MTNLTKSIKRVSNGYVFYRGKARAVVIGIEPPQIITLRLKGCKQKHQLTADELYWLAVKRDVREIEKNKRKKKIKRSFRK